MPWSPIKAIKDITRRWGILGPAIIATAIILLIVGVIWAAHDDQLF
jgi:hypothetical protein